MDPGFGGAGVVGENKECVLLRVCVERDSGMTGGAGDGAGAGAGAGGGGGGWRRREKGEGGGCLMCVTFSHLERNTLGFLRNGVSGE